MAHPPFDTTLRRWLHRISEPTTAHVPDGQLLERYLYQRDETAFEALVRRHGSLVLGVCSNVLRDVHDAEDAFQATFLVLACRAGAVRRTASVASFLHGTAYRISQRLRVQKARHQVRQRQAALQRSEISPTEPEDSETHTLLHEELSRLPRKYRDALVLCYLQGKTNEQAARELGYPLGSMSRHLRRARELLRDRLVSRGIGAALAGSMLVEPARAAVAGLLLRGTLDLVRRHALAAALFPGSTPPVAVMLAQAVLRAGWICRAMLVSAVLTLGVVLAGGMTTLQNPTAKQAEAKAHASPAERRAQSPARVDFYGDPLPEGALARMGTSQLRHPQGKHLVFSADGKTLISAGDDRILRFWDVASGKLRRLQRLPRMRKLEAISADGKTLALSTASQLLLWDITGANEIQHIETGLTKEKHWYSVIFSPDGTSLAGGNADHTVFVWDAVGVKERARFKHLDRFVPVVAFSPDGKQLAAAGDEHIMLWDLGSGRELYRIKDNRLGFNSQLSFSPNGKLLAGARYSQVVLRNAATGKEEAVLQFVPADKRFSSANLAFSPDGETIAIRSSDAVVLLDRRTRKGKKRWGIDYGGDSGPLRFSQDGKLLASLRAGKIHLWDVKSGKSLHDRASHSASVDSVALSPDGKLLATSATGDYTVRLWDAQTGKPIRFLQTPLWRNYPLFFTPDGAGLIALGRSGNCRIWDVPSGELRHVFRATDDPNIPNESMFSGSLSADGKRLTGMSIHSESKTGAGQCQRYVTTWDVASGKRIARRRLSLDKKILEIIEQLSPNGQFATVIDNRVLIYDVIADRPVRLLQNIGFGPFAFSPDGKFLALGLGFLNYPTPHTDPIQIQNVVTGENVVTLISGPVQGRAFSPDGRYLLTAEESALRLWELVTGKEVLRWRTNDFVELRYNPSNLAIAADGRSAAMGMSDPTVLIWDLAPATRQKRQLAKTDLDRLWNDLAGEDAVRAYRAIGTLIADPARAVPFLRERMKPVKEDAPRIRKLIADLGGDRFAVRDAAWKELEKMDDAAHAVLRQELPKANSLEQRRRMATLLKVPWLVRSPEKLRQIRAIAALEQIGDAEARQLLQRLASGSAEARQTRDAKMALQRLNPRR